MKAMLLAAGRGERLRPLTDTTPKPLIEVAGKPLIGYLLERLANHGVESVVINKGHLGEQIQHRLGNGSEFGLAINYTSEPTPALDSGGGIFQALPLLGADPFLVVNADVWTDYPFGELIDRKLDQRTFAHLVLVPRATHSAGDFMLLDGRVRNPDPGSNNLPLRTFSGISLLKPEFLATQQPGRFSIVPLLRAACDAQQIGGEVFHGEWRDIGTLKRLQALEVSINGGKPQCDHYS